MEIEGKALEKAIKQAKASFAIEGLTITKAQEALIKANLNGEISYQEFIEKGKTLAGIKDN
ncbi:antitoxin VbhA family protein [Shouchella shacheensis]|uniref:antitoxin VbhA family protein n=1 Tax=Shouchella shacheensis TaxID=1649580 RepID=UPI00073FDE1F|nr:antitoxin VbhA family protein [Shouchella shacheensis]